MPKCSNRSIFYGRTDGLTPIEVMLRTLKQFKSFFVSQGSIIYVLDLPETFKLFQLLPFRENKLCTITITGRPSNYAEFTNSYCSLKSHKICFFVMVLSYYCQINSQEF